MTKDGDRIRKLIESSAGYKKIIILNKKVSHDINLQYR